MFEKTLVLSRLPGGPSRTEMMSVRKMEKSGKHRQGSRESPGCGAALDRVQGGVEEMVPGARLGTMRNKVVIRTFTEHELVSGVE